MIRDYIRIFACIVLLVPGKLNMAQKIDELQKEKESTKEKIEFTRKLIEETTRRKKNNMGQLNLLVRGIELRGRMIENLNIELKITDEEIRKRESEIGRLNAELQRQKTEYEKAVYQMFINKKGANSWLFIFSSESFNQAYKRIKYLQQIGGYRKEQVREMNRTKDKILEEIKELENSRSVKRLLMKEKEEENKRLFDERNIQQQIIRRLSTEENKLRIQLRKEEEIAKKLEDAIKTLIAEEAKRKDNAIYRLTPEEQLIDQNFRSNRGRLPWPTERGIVTGYFGEHPHPVIKGVKVTNNGIDISTLAGAEVRAVFDGEVRKVVSIPGANKVVIVRHGNYLSMYSNLVDVYVVPGQKIKVKQAIGKVFTDTENDGRTVVHLEIWEENKKMDPMIWLSKEI